MLIFFRVASIAVIPTWEELTAQGRTCPCVHGASLWVLIIDHIRCILMHVRYVTCVSFMLWLKKKKIT